MFSAAKGGKLITFNVELQELHTIQALVFKYVSSFMDRMGIATTFGDVRSPCLVFLNMNQYSAVFFANSHRHLFRPASTDTTSGSFLMGSSNFGFGSKS